MRVNSTTIIRVPPEASINFKYAFDFLFKLFYVFNLSFDLDLKNVFDFIAKHLYKFDNIQSTNRMNEIYAKFQLHFDKMN